MWGRCGTPGEEHAVLSDDVADQLTLSESGTVLEQPTAAAIRDELQRLVIADRHGPLGGETEEFGTESPTDRYLLGRLAPDGTVVEPDDQDENPEASSADPGDGQPEPSAPNITSLAPSALGCTAYVTGDTATLTVSAQWASYERVHSDSDSGPPMVWRRLPIRGRTTSALTEGELAPRSLHPDYPKVVVRGRARRHDGNWLVSMFIVNTQPRPSSLRDSAWLFQVELVLTGPGDAAVFLPRPNTVSGGDEADKAEQRRLAMAYRWCPEFATGHGVGVHVTPTADDPMRAVEIRTSAVPSYEVPFTGVPDPRTDPDLPLVTAYRAWIDQQEDTIGAPGRCLDAYKNEAAAALATASHAADRIQQGIDLLRTDAEARNAFRFANRTMYLQRLPTLAAAVRSKNRELSPDQATDDVDKPANRSWRPFQLAFLLLNLPALTIPTHPERAEGDTALTDLLWFPTGGGKTEAYLGLTAYTLGIRRCQQHLGGLDSRDGVAVLMRYTLRLLTIQQFQRAAALICACEDIRRQDCGTWGDVPFRIGLWVGARVTPNRTDDAADWLKQQRGGKGAPSRALGSPHQLTVCPWCGSGLEPGRDIIVDLVIRQTLVRFPDPFCPFSAQTGLPVVVVDEEIYRLLPSLIIGTVDKFAQLTWRGETQALFGRVGRRCTRHGYVTNDVLGTPWELSSDTSQHPAKDGLPIARMERVTELRPPDLVIQDELHLISGPLGSLTGLYEAAVDRLSTWDMDHNDGGAVGQRTRIRPKVIASSATVRRAQADRCPVRPPHRGVPAAGHRHLRQLLRAAAARHPGHAKRRARPPLRRDLRARHPDEVDVDQGVCVGARRGAEGAREVRQEPGHRPVHDAGRLLQQLARPGQHAPTGRGRRVVATHQADDRGLARRYDPLLRELTSRLSSTDIRRFSISCRCRSSATVLRAPRGRSTSCSPPT